jgi:hypothetical protein
MGDGYQLIVEVDATTPDSGMTDTGVDVITSFDGIEPTDTHELEVLIEGLVMNAIMTYQQG